jgi:uncharacterized coiled-coil protein SlyX
MDVLQQQIVELDGKVEQLYKLVERICDRLNASEQDKHRALENNLTQLPETKSYMVSESGRKHFQAIAEHKDILIDDRYERSTTHDNNSEHNFSSDLQIRRLTAQLTAAYNRIAALEEQLLDCRIKS